MRNTVFITFHHEKNAELLVNRQFADAVHLALFGFLTVGFGCLKKDMFYAVSEDLPDNSFSLALSAAKDLHLPSGLPFEITYENGFLNIGPCIGLLLSREDNKFKKSRLEKILSYTHDYPAIHGAIIVFALNQMDMAGKTVTGFCFNPSVQKFERGIYPLPSAVYRTVGLSKAQKEEFRTALNGRYFNSDYFSKWTMYEWLKQNNETAPYLPETMRYETPEAALEAAGKHHAVYLKPIAGLGGHGIARLSAIDGGSFLLELRDTPSQPAALSRDQAIEAVRSCASGKYLVQQAIDLPKFHGSSYDFRCVMQKNQAAIWECRAIIGRCGKEGSIVTNISSGGHAFPIERFRPEDAGLPFYPADKLAGDIRKLALSVCQAIDGCGIHCGTLGLDIAVDINGKLWLIEANNRDPDPSIALDVRDMQLYYQIKSGPLFYAKALAGFPDEDGERRP